MPAGCPCAAGVIGIVLWALEGTARDMMGTVRRKLPFFFDRYVRQAPVRTLLRQSKQTSVLS